LTDIVISTDDVPEGRGPTGAAARENRVVTVEDFATDERMLPWREAALKRGYHGSAGLPLRFKGKVIGTLTLYSGEPNYFDSDLLALLEEEIMLGLPMAPRHAEGECRVPGEAGDTEARQVSAFAALARLKQ
jgi:transcriptional regulator with GAF, ATPase, and Fis domain